MPDPDAFIRALAFVLSREAGYCNVPGDRGGETNLGISDLRDGVKDGLADLDGDGKGDVPIRDLRAELAGQIYRRDYWDKIGLSELHPAVAAAVFDAAVNLGPGRAVQLLQRAINKQCAEPPLVVDGDLGAKTKAALRQLAVMGVLRELCADLLFERVAHYVGLCERNHGQDKFLRGWLNRTLALRQLCDELGA